MISTRKMRTMSTDIVEESFDDEEVPVPQDHEVAMLDDSVSDDHLGIKQEGSEKARPTLTLDVSLLQSFHSVDHTQRNCVSRDLKKLLSNQSGAWTLQGRVGENGEWR
jgi:hypothetical protein